MSIPFVNKEFTFTQPDGTKFRVRGTGDQRSAIFKTLEGYPIVRDPLSGFYQYARISNDKSMLLPSRTRADAVPPQPLNQNLDLRSSSAPLRDQVPPSIGLPHSSLSRWQIRRKQSQDAMHAAVTAKAAVPHRQPKVGKYLGLCLLVQFPDVPGVITADQVTDFCNKNNYQEFGNKGSVRDYYFDNSGGKLTYTNIVTPYYTAKQQRSYYTDERIEYTTRAQELVQEALANLVASGFDFAKLSVDAENYILAVNLFYAGERINNNRQGLWPHQSSLTTPFAVAANKWANDYQISDMGNELTLGTFCHENGHMICDFPDLYSSSEDWNGVGMFCLMAFGCVDSNKKNPTQICAYLKHLAGWASATYTIAPHSHYALRAGHNEFAISQKKGNEYFIAENREQTGRDGGISDSGLAIWHVDESGDNYHVTASPSGHRECTLVQADGNQTIDDGTDLYPDGSNNRLDDSTTPSSKWLDGSASGIDIKNITAPGPNVTFST